MTPGRRGWIVLALLAFAATGAAWGHDHEHPELDAWYAGLMQPDQPLVSCCGAADAYWADEIHVRDGKTFAVITDDREDAPLGRPHVDVGTEVEIPNYKLKFDRGNPTGHGVLFMRHGIYGDYVFCFVQAGGV